MTTIDNRTPWPAAVLAVSGPRGQPWLTVVVEATCRLAGGEPAPQPPIQLDGVWDGDPATTAPREAPSAPLAAGGTDCLLRGTAHAPLVRFSCGPVTQAAQVVGARTWVRRWLGVRPSDPAPFTPLPLAWELACGPQPANPVGCGLVVRRERFRDGVAVPRIVDPADPPRRWGVAVRAPGFGPTTPAWAHRRDRDPFDPAAHQCAAPELIAPRLAGDEPLLVEGCARPIATRLPGLPPPRLRLATRDGDHLPSAGLDMVLIDADALTVRFTWRATLAAGEPSRILAVEIA